MTVLMWIGLYLLGALVVGGITLVVGARSQTARDSVGVETRQQVMAYVVLFGLAWPSALIVLSLIGVLGGLVHLMVVLGDWVGSKINPDGKSKFWKGI